jgi:NhaP-type Na+/H+ or K+/H+ antiporter
MQHVIFWGGLRGAICLALALSLPAELVNLPASSSYGLGVVLFTY